MRAVMRTRLSFLATVVAVVASCGGSAATPAHSNASRPQFLTGNGTKWQVVITADHGNVTGPALDSRGDIYLAEIDSDEIAEYSLSGRLLRKWGTHGSGSGQLSAPAPANWLDKPRPPDQDAKVPSSGM